MKHIPDVLYQTVCQLVPILCVDLVIEDDGKYLLVKREKEPLRGRWWVPGGRVIKGETLLEAAHRKAAQELGIIITPPHPIGYFEAHFNRRRAAGNKHTVSIVMAARSQSPAIRLDDQSSAWRWSQELPSAFKIQRFDGA
jgi:colanic acid biosynthesis protein WcaH